MQTLTTLLEAHPFFKGMDDRFLPFFSSVATITYYEGDASIFAEGEHAAHFYLIIKGKVTLETFSAEHGVIPIETIEEGEALGWSWLFPPYRWHFSARTAEPVDLIALDAERLRAQCEADHDFGYELVQRVAHVMMQRLQATRLQLLDVYRVPHGRGKG
jgi:CRP/FNR family cyclic AMP-dependent transcriptional regulator